MAEGVLEQLLIDVRTVGVAVAGGELDRLSRSVGHTDDAAKKATKSHLGLGAAFGGLKGMAGTAIAAVGATGIAGAFGESIKNAMAFQQAHGQLSNSIRRNVRGIGGDAADATAELTDSGESLSMRGGFAGPENIGALTQFVRVTHDTRESVKDLSLATDLARGTHKSFATAIRAVMGAENGRTTGLSRMGIVIPKVTTAQDALRDSHVKVTTAMRNRAKEEDAAASKQRTLETITRRFAGSTSTYAHSAAGAMSSFRNAVEVLSVKLGSVFLPIITKVFVGLSHFVDGMLKGEGAGGKFVGVLKTAVQYLSDAWKWVKANATVFEILGGAILGVAVAARALLVINTLINLWKLWQSGTIALTLAMKAQAAAEILVSTAGIVGIIFAIIGALVVAYLKVKPFREAVQAVFGAIKAGFNWLKNAIGTVVGWALHHWRLLILAIGPLGFVIDIVSKHFTFFKGIVMDVFGFVYSKTKWVVGQVTNIWGAITKALTGPFNSAKGVIQTVLDGILTAVRWIVGKLTTLFGKITGPIKWVADHVGGVIHTLSHAGGKIGKFLGFAQSGGMVTGGGPFLVGERGPEIVSLPRGSRVTPNSELGGGGSDRPIVIYNILDGKVLSKSVIRQGLLQAARS